MGKKRELKTKVTLGALLRTYSRMLRGMRWPFVVTMTLTVFAAGIGMISPWLYKDLFDTIASVSPSAEIADQAFHIVYLILGVHLVGFLGWRGAGFLTAWTVTRTHRRLQDESFSYLLSHSYRFFSDRFSGSLVRQLNRFVEGVDRLHEVIQWEFLPLAVTLIIASISLMVRSTLLGSACIIWIAIYIYVNYRLGSWKQKYDERLYEADSAVVGALSDAVTNHLNIKVFTAQAFEEARYQRTVDQFVHWWRFTWNLSEVLTSVQAFFSTVFELVIIWICIYLWRDGKLTIGDFALVQGFAISILHQMWDFGRHVRRVFETVGSAADFLVVLQTPHEIQDVPHAKPLHVTKGRIEFRDVSFRYRDSHEILQKFDLTVAPDEKIALVGPSGAGKTTVTKLLMRFYNLTDGAVLIDGQDISQVTQESLLQSIGFVPQEPLLFHRSLRENIRYGKPKATDKEVCEAAKKARCHEFIIGLPKGYETLVGERGVKLSGGERQRVAIARAILKNAPILVLDEATSSLDSESEQMIQASLAELMKGKTVIVIAHRLSTIMKMDRIIVMDQGRVTEQGTHEQLLEKVGTYKRLWSIQAGGFGG